MVLLKSMSRRRPSSDMNLVVRHRFASQLPGDQIGVRKKSGKYHAQIVEGELTEPAL
jgi:hypothetical protein